MRPGEYDGTIVSIRVNDVAKGSHSVGDTVKVLMPGGIEPLPLPGDQAVLFLEQVPSGDFEPQMYNGIYHIAGGNIVPL